MKYRALEEALDINHEAIRKFVEGITVMPHPATRKIYAELYLLHHPAGYVAAERKVEGAAPLPPLKQVLPPGREPALGVIERLCELARRHPDELPAETDALERHWRRQVNAEYDAEAKYPVPRRRGPPKK
ncbi:MAG TPA: hypothetical protein VFQ45_00940 [Longimicrobium sp.]|nr:hypothetical protein [Longimicrobium sp.]